MGKHRLTAAVLTFSVLGFSLTACSGEDRPAPEDAAGTLAEGLSQLDVSGSSFLGATPDEVNTQLAESTAGLAPLTPQVAVGSVEETAEDEAMATLKYVWDVNASETDYSYDTTVALQRNEEDVWEVKFTPAAVHPDLAPGDRLVREVTPAPRADIIGSGGQVIVTERAVWSVGIDKTWVGEEELAASAARLAEFLELDPAAYTAQVEAAGAEAFVEAVTLRQDSVSPPEEFKAQVAEIPGAAAIAGTLPLAPTRTFARALLGSVGQATAELIDASDGALSAGDVTGLSGLQQQYDEQLRGTDGVVIRTVNAEDVPSAPLFQSERASGQPLQTTLDARMQNLAESVLEDEPSASALVAIQPSSGNILAVANGPGSEGAQTALLGQYAPGSTFKMATSLAMLRSGAAPETAVSCPEELNVDGRLFNNASTYPAQFLGEIPLRQAFAQSCNTAFINARGTVAQPDLASAAQSLGLGVTASIGTPAYFGSVPEAAEGTLHAASMIGQGEVLVSPLALAVAGASVAKGERVSPALVQPANAASGSSAPASGSAAPEAAPLTAGEAETLRSLMRSVVTDGGVQLLQSVPGEPVLAKTGTAEFGSDTPPRTHAWVVAIQGDLAVALFIEEGELGSTSGGPVMKAFLDGLAG
ncbi:penicillin-binding transpeptidase domain-containing protein [Arthrobacter caoxuetaonis]|uniref:penicillin-binding transpeptidase domain-containing protein n=1 Tax=Arthrobacter caoxuetaonis TaxID=2886935 RepID=UPI001D13769D|nr:penicillin-binding transpeptidase domain-containing protein [Arthrobacter caoxuetaonis]MCC3281442.1 penicillin-binding protein [Arthrobacter caoxuetaonis]